MIKEPLVSIIINCFNGEKYLDECLNSILSQEYTNYEVIFWDNLSKDNSKSIFLKIKDKRFKYFSDNKFVSLYCARNKAINVTKGEYISFLDVDDLILPNKLKEQIYIMKSNPKIGFCYSGFKILNQGSGKLYSAYLNKFLKEGNLSNSLLKNYNIGIPTLLVNKETVIANQIKFDDRFTIMGDLDFVIRLSKVSLGYPIKKDLAIWRKHTTNLSLNLSLTVQERKIWQEEMISRLIFTKKQMLPFIEETKYLIFQKKYKNASIMKLLKLVFALRGFFLVKSIIIIIKSFKTKFFLS